MGIASTTCYVNDLSGVNDSLSWGNSWLLSSDKWLVHPPATYANHMLSFAVEEPWSESFAKAFVHLRLVNLTKEFGSYLNDNPLITSSHHDLMGLIN